jgi:hypothetical protein
LRYPSGAKINSCFPGTSAWMAEIFGVAFVGPDLSSFDFALIMNTIDIYKLVRIMYSSCGSIQGRCVLDDKTNRYGWAGRRHHARQFIVTLALLLIIPPCPPLQCRRMNLFMRMLVVRVILAVRVIEGHPVVCTPKGASWAANKDLLLYPLTLSVLKFCRFYFVYLCSKPNRI